MEGEIMKTRLNNRSNDIGFRQRVKELITLIQKASIENLDYEIMLKDSDELSQLEEVIIQIINKVSEYGVRMRSELLTQRKQKEEIFNVYKDVIYAVTQGKLLLINQEEIKDFLNQGNLLAEITINKPEDVGVCRDLARKFLTHYLNDPIKIKKIILAVSEGATNVIKHAQNGKFSIIEYNGYLRLIFNDRGPGMPYDKIPHMVLFKGFSTKISLGCGFSLIYHCSDKLGIYTSSSGTTLILENYVSNII